MFEKFKKFSSFLVILSFCFSVSEAVALGLDGFINADELPVGNEVQRLKGVDCFINVHVLNNTLSLDFGIENEKSLALHYYKNNEEDGVIIGNHRFFTRYHRKMINLLSPALKNNGITSVSIFGHENSQHANTTDRHISDVLECLKDSEVSTLNLCLKLPSPELIFSIKEKMSALPLKEVFFYLQEGNLYRLEEILF